MSLKIETTTDQPRLRLFWIIFAVIMLVAILMRCAIIELRPFHSDEGVNYYFIERMNNLGYYPYSHQNYHGPSFFYLTWFFTSIFGYSELAFRASAYVPSLLMLLVLLSLRRVERDLTVLFTCLAVALSTTLIFVGRYAIHETLFVLSQLGLAVSIYLWQRERIPKHLYSAGLWLALLAATKETYVIAIFCLFIAFHFLGDWKRVYRDLFVTQRQHFMAALALSLFVVLFTFTAGFTWWQGITEFLSGVQQWMGRTDGDGGDHGHFKPWGYYLEMLGGTEILVGLKSFFLSLGMPLDAKSWRKVATFGTETQLVMLPVILFVTAIVLKVYRIYRLPQIVKDDQTLEASAASPNADLAVVSESNKKSSLNFLKADWTKFCYIWALLAFVVYSVLNYKTPWLIINITLPLSIAIAGSISNYVSGSVLSRSFGALLFLLYVGLAANTAFTYNFKLPYGQENPHSYVHTHHGMMRLIADIRAYLVKHPKARILIGVKQYWPLPYYLRDVKSQLGYMQAEKAEHVLKDYDIIIAPPKYKPEVPGTVKKYYRLSEVQESDTYFRTN